MQSHGHAIFSFSTVRARLSAMSDDQFFRHISDLDQRAGYPDGTIDLDRYHRIRRAIEAQSAIEAARAAREAEEARRKAIDREKSQSLRRFYQARVNGRDHG